MNLVLVPYHDWRKIKKEGARTRDSHLINHFIKSDRVQKILIINRPTSYPEIFASKKPLGIKGEVCFSQGGIKLYQVESDVYVLDFVTLDLFSPILKRRSWAFDSFGYTRLTKVFERCLSLLGMNEYYLFSNNIFSLEFVKRTNAKKTVFDAYDNLLFFPHNKPILGKLRQAYQEFVGCTDFWTTNSMKNVNYYLTHYGQNNCELVKNGVDIDLFQNEYPVPDDMNHLERPIVGFGGKITHLFDYELFNRVVQSHPNCSFVIIGQVLDNEVFEKIISVRNVYYLGDKHYSIYPSYVTNFDVGIIPYVTNELESGVDSIKAYEYVAAGLSCVGTAGGGMPDLSEFIFVANDADHFDQLLDEALKTKRHAVLPDNHTWAFKANLILDKMLENRKY